LGRRESLLGRSVDPPAELGVREFDPVGHLDGVRLDVALVEELDREDVAVPV